MTQSLPSLDSIFQSIVLATLAIRFLWDRNLNLGGQPFRFLAPAKS
ncbi:MAG: hypothetical protein WA639_17140 [Candidatus Acidiferrum sp.]